MIILSNVHLVVVACVVIIIIIIINISNNTCHENNNCITINNMFLNKSIINRHKPSPLWFSWTVTSSPYQQQGNNNNDIVIVISTATSTNSLGLSSSNSKNSCAWEGGRVSYFVVVTIEVRETMAVRLLLPSKVLSLIWLHLTTVKGHAPPIHTQPYSEGWRQPRTGTFKQTRACRYKQAYGRRANRRLIGR